MITNAHSTDFKGGIDDGEVPVATLIAVDGELCGTTEFGGNCYEHGRCGTIFKVTSGAETILYFFKGVNDGANPFGSLCLL